MRTVTTQVVVVGAGTAGLVARREAARAGARTLLVEEGPHGTTCARVGCMPSKLLIAAADVAHHVARAERFGIRLAGTPRVDGVAVLERVRRERDGFVASVLDAVGDIPEDERLRGRARFVGTTTLEVDDHTRVEASSVVIATGAQPWLPDELEAAGDDVLTSDDLFELRDLPASLGVFGAGLVGLELGQALTRLGVRTAFFDPADRVGPFTDPVLADAAREALARELDLRVDPALRYSVTARERGVHRVRWRVDADDRNGATRAQEHEDRFERVLAAAGRRPRLEALELAKAGIELDARGVPRFDPHTLQCGDAPVFVAGDADDDRPFLHEASDEGAIAGRNAATWPEVAPGVRRTPLAIGFTDPQMALVGRAWRSLGSDAAVAGAASYEDQGRARILDRNAGRLHVYAERTTGRLLGAEMLGPDVEHTAHLLAWAVQRGLTAREAYDLPFYHPVVEEALRTALRDACSQLGQLCRSRPRDLEHGPGA